MKHKKIKLHSNPIIHKVMKKAGFKNKSEFAKALAERFKN